MCGSERERVCVEFCIMTTSFNMCIAIAGITLTKKRKRNVSEEFVHRRETQRCP